MHYIPIEITDEVKEHLREWSLPKFAKHYGVGLGTAHNWRKLYHPDWYKIRGRTESKAAFMSSRNHSLLKAHTGHTTTFESCDDQGVLIVCVDCNERVMIARPYEFVQKSRKHRRGEL